MCNCIKKTEARLLEHLREKYPDRIINMDHDDGLQNQAFTFGEGSGENKIYIDFFSHYTFKKKDGSQSVSKKDTVRMFFTFCPFCGEPYNKPKKGDWVKTFVSDDNRVIITHDYEDNDVTPYVIAQRVDYSGVKAEVNMFFATEEDRDVAFNNYDQESADEFYKGVKKMLTPDEENQTEQ